MICPPDPFQTICHNHQANQPFECKSSAGYSHWGHQYVFEGCKWHSIWQFWCLLLPRLVTVPKGRHHNWLYPGPSWSKAVSWWTPHTQSRAIMDLTREAPGTTRRFPVQAASGWCRATFQLALPSAKRSLVLPGFHNEMSHLGRDKILDLIDLRFCRPSMAKDVENLMESGERWVERKSLDPPKAWIVPSLITEPMKLSAIDFLSISLEKVNQHVQMVTDSPPNIRGHSQHEISRSLQEPRCCRKRFWGTLVSLSGYTLTKAVTLNPELLKIYLCKVAGIERPEERHTIRRGMAKLSGSIARSWACSARLTMIRRATGQTCCPNEWSKWL